MISQKQKITKKYKLLNVIALVPKAYRTIYHKRTSRKGTVLDTDFKYLQ
jgi:hypothetical protein